MILFITLHKYCHVISMFDLLGGMLHTDITRLMLTCALCLPPEQHNVIQYVSYCFIQTD